MHCGSGRRLCLSPDLALVQRLHAGVPVVDLPDQLQVPVVRLLQVCPQLVPLPTGLLRRLPEEEKVADLSCDSKASEAARIHQNQERPQVLTHLFTPKVEVFDDPDRCRILPVFKYPAAPKRLWFCLDLS